MHNQFVVVRFGGEERESTIAGRLRRARPVVGDRVEIRELPDRSVRVEAVLPRHGTLLRGAFRNEEKIVAANVDVLVIVAAVADPPLRTGLIDRYLVAAWRGGIAPMIALTKVDLPYDEAEVARVREIYGALGHRVTALSLRTGEGLDELRSALADRVAVLAGHSGVGKTSLTNALTGRDDATGAAQPGERSRAPHDDRRQVHGPARRRGADRHGGDPQLRHRRRRGSRSARRPSLRSPRPRRTANGRAACTARTRTAAPCRTRPA